MDKSNTLVGSSFDANEWLKTNGESLESKKKWLMCQLQIFNVYMKLVDIDNDIKQEIINFVNELFQANLETKSS